MQNTEKGRKITTAAVNTSRAVAATSKAVGMSLPNYYYFFLNKAQLNKTFYYLQVGL